ncbi:hypothetical protein FJT64_021437 [Amphibalanus amphitrite]|uniref:Uncharacterized protein n=1 Tax=Amphibalanus amphitrite TaxID=1232801 RepID=A0A6A4WYN6_AMPAM|nr:hypothetical protein FJT64_021437 [Amphibalanus amphitrite]
MVNVLSKFTSRFHPPDPGISLVHSREAAEKQQREAEKQQREAEKQQREAAERLRQEEERKKQQQAVSQHFAESMRLMQQKGRLGSAPPGSSAGGLPGLPPAPPSGRYSDLRPGDVSSEPERMIHDRIHRLYQSTEPAGQHKPEPAGPAAAAVRPGYPGPDYLASYYDQLKGVQMHAAKPPPPQPQPVADRHSPYLPAAPPGTYQGALRGWGPAVW